MASRDEDALQPILRAAWEYLQVAWEAKYPDGPEPFLTCTYRPPAEQIELVRQGKSNARPGESLHNYYPSYAFDVAFLQDGRVTWEFHWFEKFGVMAEELGLVWGGRWEGLVDGPHIQLPVTWQEARDGVLPILPEIPELPLPPANDDLHTLVYNGDPNDFLKLLTLEPERVVIRGVFVSRRRGDKLDLREA